MKLSLFKKDPEKKAKKLIDKGDYYWDIDDLDSAANHYEKAARIYEDLNKPELAVKYYFEAARCGLELDDEEMAAKYKSFAALILMKENKAQEVSDIMNEVSDHFIRSGKIKEAARALGIAIISAIASSDFNHAINLTKKIKRKSSKSKKMSHPVLTLAEYLTKIICNGEMISESIFEKAVSKASFNDIENSFISPVIEGARLSHGTKVEIIPVSSLNRVVTGKTLKFLIKIESPVPSQVISTSLPVSRNLIITKEPQFSDLIFNEEVKFELKASISGSATVGPFKITLKSEKAILYKITNSIEFEIAPPKAKIELFVESEEYSVSPSNEFQINVGLKNMRSDSIDNILLKAEYQEGISLSLGTDEKTIGILPGNAEMDFPFYFTASEPGEKIIMFKAFEKERSKKPLDQVAIKIRVG